MTGQWGQLGKRAWCTACNDGWVGHFTTVDGRTALYVCTACEASWLSPATFDPGESRPLADLLAHLGLPPGPDSLTDVSHEAWFADLGYSLSVWSDADGVFWAALAAVNNPDFVARQYGRGVSPAEAAESARRRWQTEQIGSPTGHRRGRRRPLPP